MHTLSPRLLTRYAIGIAVLAGGALAAASCAKSVKIDPGDEAGAGGGGTSSGGPGGGISVGGAAGNTPPIGTQCDASNPCHDFPTSPVFDTTNMSNPPSNAPQIFGAPGSGSSAGGPCIQEPQDNTLFPRNWLRPRVLYTASGSQNLFEIRVHTDVEANDLVVYTTNTQWTFDKTTDPTNPSIWDQLRSKAIMAPIVVTVRGANTNGGSPTVSTSATFYIAPAEAGGALIYWTTQSFDKVANNTTLQGFQVGDEGTTTALTSDQVQQPVRAQSLDGGNLQPAQFNQVFCIGCHSATPDGVYVAFTSQWPWANALATVAVDAGIPVGSAPPFLSTAAASNLSPNINGYYAPPTVAQTMMGIQTFSPAHYQTGDRVVIGALGAAWNQTQDQINAGSPGSPTGVTSQLAWFDLEYQGALPAGTPGQFNPGMLTSPLAVATPCQGGGCATSTGAGAGWGIIARQGDSNSAGAPSWSHGGMNGPDVIAYASTDVGTKDGRMDCSSTSTPCKSDVYTVPYNNRAGGTASPLPGASDSAYNEYYPAWSSDDQLIAFNRVAAGVSMYNEPQAEVYVVPYAGGAGGDPIRLAANDPPACSGKISPGVQNTWPKWAPNVQQDSSGMVYYWVTFSSTRHPKANGRQQLYVAGIVYNPDTQKFKTYSGIYLWNQSYLFNNLIPSWQNFQIAHGTTLPPT